MKMLFMLAITIPLISFAESKIDAKDSMECESKNQYQAEIASCILQKQGDTKKPLNKAYIRVASFLSGNVEASTNLENMQKNWVSARNQQCSFEADLTERGADKYLVEQSCLNYLNKQRTAYLNSIELD